MFRDSFGNALYPFMADTFENATFSRLMPYRMDWLDGGTYDNLVVEIVERNLKNLALQAPVMPAPIVSLNGDVTDGETHRHLPRFQYPVISQDIVWFRYL